MGFEERDYYRDGPRGEGVWGGIGHWLLYGRVYLFTAFGIRVHAHSSLIIAMALTLLFLGGGKGYGWQDAVIATVLLFLIVLLHEFGHCFGARWSGGDAEEIVMHPLGGLALTQPRPSWQAHLITTAAGPAVNVALCIICGVTLYLISGRIPWKPFYIEAWTQFDGWLDPEWLLFWIYQTNWALLLFNLMPIYPLDGGRMVQEILWPRVGYYRSMLIAATTGFIGAIIGGMVAVATGAIGLLALAILGAMSCYQMRRMLLENGPWGFSEYDDPISQSLHETSRAQRVDTKRAVAFAKKQAAQARKEQEQAASDEAEIDRILAKVSASGMQSLSGSEQRTLKRATERQQKREAARGR